MQNLVAGFLHELGTGVIVFVNAVAKTHELDIRVFIFDLVHELADFGHATHSLDVFEHVQAGLVGAAVGGAPQAGHTSGDGRERVGA